MSFVCCCFHSHCRRASSHIVGEKREKKKEAQQNNNIRGLTVIIIKQNKNLRVTDTKIFNFEKKKTLVSSLIIISRIVL